MTTLHDPPARALSRRALLQGSGVAAAGALAASALPAHAQEPPPPATPAMRSPARALLPVDAAAAPPLPPLFVIAANRMGFGPRPGDYSAYATLGDSDVARFTAYVDQQTRPGSIDDSACDARIAAAGFATLTKNRRRLWSDHAADGSSWETRMQPAEETMIATFLRAIYSKRQLLEVLADFWHNHFNVYGWDYWSGPTWVHYDRDVIRANALGNFRTLLQAVAQSPAMLYYLDNVSNTSAGPNENFARELFELHGLGAENYLGVASTVGPKGEYLHPAPPGPDGIPSKYVDEDVYAATQCFTGWRIDRDTGDFSFDDSAHEKYAKIVLGRNIASGSGVQDGLTVLDLLANHPGTARFIARKLCRRLLSDTPPASVVEAAAAVFYARRNDPDQLRHVVKTILLSEEFRTTWGQKIKRPFEFVVSLLRASGADFAWGGSFSWMYRSMGQALFDWRPPNGYPDLKENWSSTMPMLQRWRMVNFLMDRWTYGGDGANKDTRRIDFLKQMPADVQTPSAIVGWWAQRLLSRPLPPEELAPILEFMAGGRSPDAAMPAEMIEERLRFMCGLIFMAPSFQWR